ncbi:hypothetical protein DRQ09_05765 [candidate division KSB1 bacterium]|nr:MAG: hypothetical protein DRQ09_05765 [candidate division KSB1 bacterium]
MSLQKVIDLKNKNRNAKNIALWCHIRRGYIFDLQGLRNFALEEYKKSLEFPDYRDSKKKLKND